MNPRKTAPLRVLAMGLIFATAMATATAADMATAQAAVIGDLGRKLSEEELGEILRLAGTAAKEPWLVVAKRGQFGVGEYVQVYCAPTMDTPGIRRGSRALLSRRLPGAKGTLGGWRLDVRGWYAQVAVPGRDFARIGGVNDVNLPFDVGPKLSSEDLVSLVNLVRSGPTWTSPAGASERIEGGWPVESIGRDPGGLVVIKTRKDGSRGQLLKLRRVKDQWQIASIGYWIA